MDGCQQHYFSLKQKQKSFLEKKKNNHYKKELRSARARKFRRI